MQLIDNWSMFRRVLADTRHKTQESVADWFGSSTFIWGYNTKPKQQSKMIMIKTRHFLWHWSSSACTITDYTQWQHCSVNFNWYARILCKHLRLGEQTDGGKMSMTSSLLLLLQKYRLVSSQMESWPHQPTVTHTLTFLMNHSDWTTSEKKMKRTLDKRDCSIWKDRTVKAAFVAHKSHIVPFSGLLCNGVTFMTYLLEGEGWDVCCRQQCQPHLMFHNVPPEMLC